MKRNLTVALGLLALLTAPAYSLDLVNDSFSDLDRIGGFDGSSTDSTAPSINPPTATNTQWVVNGSSSMVATGSGMNWTMNNTSNRMGIGYFPDVTVGSDAVTFNLNFTTGTYGPAPNNLRMAIFDASPSGIRETDGFSSSEDSYVNDVGYGFFSGSSNVGGGDTTDLTLRTYERTDLSNNLLGSSSQWTELNRTDGATGYLQENTTYDLVVTMMESAGVLSITTELTGGNLSGFVIATEDTVDPTLTFNAIAMRWGGGSLQFTDFTFNSFAVTVVPEPSTFAALAGLLALVLVAVRRRK